MGYCSDANLSANERYIDEGPTTPPPAPESRIAAVILGNAGVNAGRWRKLGTVPSGPSSTLISHGITFERFEAFGGWERPK